MVEIVEREQEIPVSHEPPHMGIIPLSLKDAPDVLKIDLCDTQGHLQDEGVFDRLHHHLDLPPSFIIQGVFLDILRRSWYICVECEDLPPVGENEDFPRLYLRYCKDEGIERPRLVTIDVERYQRVYPLSDYLKYV